MAHLINSQQVNNSDPNVQDALVKANIRVAIIVANQFKDNGLTFVELINKGTRGLAIAARNYDHYNEFDFATYAIWYIRQAILQAIMEKQQSISVPLNKIGLKPQNHFSFIRPDYYFQREPSSRDMEGIKKFQMKIMDSNTMVHKR
ncbi:MAG TPA: sigma factor [Prolixibacteraceae bacterium]|nr:sigma factor [Prolixibacteraceae bacterium]